MAFRIVSTTHGVITQQDHDMNQDSDSSLRLQKQFLIHINKSGLWIYSRDKMRCISSEAHQTAIKQTWKQTKTGCKKSGRIWRIDFLTINARHDNLLTNAWVAFGDMRGLALLSSRNNFIASLIPLYLQLTERGHLRSTPLEQICT